MRDLLISVEFWVAVTLATVVKLRASRNMSRWMVIVTILTATGSALVFTKPVLNWLDLDGETYTAGVAALVALTAEHLMRQLLEIRIVDLLKAWKGK